MDIIIILTIMIVSILVVALIAILSTRKYLRQKAESKLLNEYLTIQAQEASVERAIHIINWKRKLARWSDQNN